MLQTLKTNRWKDAKVYQLKNPDMVNPNRIGPMPNKFLIDQANQSPVLANNRLLILHLYTFVKSKSAILLLSYYDPSEGFLPSPSLSPVSVMDNCPSRV